VQSNEEDQHAAVRVTIAGGQHTLRIRTQDDFGLGYDSTLPAQGEVSQGLRILSETWSAARDRLTVKASGIAGGRYELSVWNPGQIASADGIKIVKASDGRTMLLVELPKNGDETVSHTTFSIQFARAGQGRAKR
jgi:hypothetical protein